MGNEKKAFRPNGFDIVVVILILALAAGVYVISHKDDVKQAEVTKVVYTVEIANVTEGTGQLISEGDELKDNKNSCSAGIVRSVETEPYTIRVTDKENNIARMTPVEGKENILITLEADATISEHNILTNNDTALRVGSELSCSNSQFTGNGYVVSIVR